MAVLPKIVYNFNENDASTIRDYSENGNDGTGSNLTIQDSTRIGKEAVFNGVNDVIDLGNITYLNGATDMSIHLGISIDSSTASGYILIKDSQLLVYYNNTTSEIEIYLFVASGTAAVSAALTDDTYYDIDVIYTSNNLTIYVDGVLIETDSTESGAIATNTNDLTIGVATLSAFFLLNEFKLYSDSITTDIIDAVILNPNGVVSDNGVVSEFAIGDVLYTDLDNIPKYAIVSYVSTTTSEYRILPLTSGIFSGNALNRGGHLWDASRQSGLKIDKTPQICFYDGQSKSTEIFAESKKTYCVTKDGPTTILNEVSSDYNILPSDSTINCTFGTFTLTLPTAIGVESKVYNIKNSGTGVVTVNTTLNQLIDADSSGDIQLIQYDNLQIQSNGSNWIII